MVHIKIMLPPGLASLDLFSMYIVFVVCLFTLIILAYPCHFAYGHLQKSIPISRVSYCKKSLSPSWCFSYHLPIIFERCFPAMPWFIKLIIQKASTKRNIWDDLHLNCFIFSSSDFVLPCPLHCRNFLLH